MKKFKARHNHNDKLGEFEFSSLKLAQFRNPDFRDWEEVKE